MGVQLNTSVRAHHAGVNPLSHLCFRTLSLVGPPDSADGLQDVTSQGSCLCSLLFSSRCCLCCLGLLHSSGRILLSYSYFAAMAAHLLLQHLGQKLGSQEGHLLVKSGLGPW